MILTLRVSLILRVILTLRVSLILRKILTLRVSLTLRIILAQLKITLAQFKITLAQLKIILALSSKLFSQVNINSSRVTRRPWPHTEYSHGQKIKQFR